MLFDKKNETVLPDLSPAAGEAGEDSLSRFDGQPFVEAKYAVQGVRRKVLTIAVVPAAIILLFVGLTAWRLSTRSADTEDLGKTNPVNTVQTSKLPEIAVFETDGTITEIVFNEKLTANGAIVVSPSLQPTEAVSGQIYFDETANSLRLYDGSGYRQVVSIDEDDQICFVTNNCGYAKISDIPTIPAVPDAVELPQDLSVTASPNFAGLTLGTDLSVANGGTGRSTFANNAVLLGAGSGAINVTNTPLSGQLLFTNASGVPQFMSLSGDISIDNSGVIDLNSNTVTPVELANTSVVAGTYGDGVNYPVFTVDADGRITNATTQPVPGGGGGVGSVNALVGALTLQGTANQVSVASGGATITLSTPQDIAASSSPTFNGLSLTSLIIGGDTLTDLTGTGLQVNAGSLETTLGNTVSGAEVVDGSLTNADLTNSSLTVSAGTGLTGGCLLYTSDAADEEL
jgi:hypothetical protein